MRLIYFNVPESAMGNELLLGFIVFLRNKMGEFASCHPQVIADWKEQLEIISNELPSLESFLKHSALSSTQHIHFVDLRTRMKNLAYETEYAVDLIVVGDFPGYFLSWEFTNLVEEIKLIKVMVKQLRYGASSQAKPCMSDRFMMGFEKEAEQIKERLGSWRRNLDVICVVGTSGLRKTTLANIVYNDPLVLEWFYIRAWCCVSPVYRRREVLFNILFSSTDVREEQFMVSDETLEEMVYKYLKGKKFLIVLDDVCFDEAWCGLSMCFPDDPNGSRILITSRNNDVAFQDRNNSPIYLRFLTSDEVMYSLEKIFQDNRYPLISEKDRMEIVKKCQGLPFAFAEIARLVDQCFSENTPDLWKQVLQRFDSNIVHGLVAKLDLVYKQLPCHLKLCFLYCGALFPNHKEFPVMKLMQLWIAEELVQKIEGKSLEDVAEEYLIDLAGRGLILVSKRRSDGRIKTCRIPDIMLDLSQRKAVEVNFVEHIHGCDHKSSSSVYQQRRLFICSKWKQFLKSRPTRPHARSLLLLAADDDDSFAEQQHLHDDISAMIDSFKLLRVLDLECFNAGGSFPDEIKRLVHLRYLAVKGTFNQVSPSIAKLWTLETLIVKGLRGAVELADTISSMKNLRYLHVSSYGFCRSGLATILKWLHTLSTLHVSDHLMHQITRNTPNLRKLGLIISDSEIRNGPAPILLRELELLIHLETLKLSYQGRVCSSINFDFCFPPGLTKLIVSKFHLPWSEMSRISRSLLNLQVLKLLCNAFKGKQWDTEDGEFQKLRFLKLESLDVQVWESNDDDFPRLEQLVLCDCKNLEAIPYSLGSIPTLQTIQVNCCTSSVVDSATEILEWQQDMGNELFRVLIHPPPHS